MNFTKLLGAGKSLVGMKDQDCPYRMRAENLLPKFEAAKNPFASTIKAGSKIEYNSNPLPVATVAPAPAPVQPAIMETRPLFGPDLQPVVVSTGAEVVNAPNARLISLPATFAISVVAEKTEIPEPIEIKIANPAPAPIPVAAIAPQVIAEPVEEPAAEPIAKAAVKIDVKVEAQTDNVVAVKTESLPAPVPAPAPRAPRSWSLSGLLQKVNPFAPRDRVEPRPRAPMQFELSLDRIRVIRNDLHDSDIELVSPTISIKPAGKTARLQTLARNEATALSRMTAKFFGVEETQVR